MNAEPTLRAARADECAALSALALRSKAVWGYSAEFLARCAGALTVTEAHLPHVFVRELAGTVVGFHAVSLDAPRRAELEFLFVDPPYRGQGHGRALLAHARLHARAAFGARRLVIAGDPNADAFYRAAGARRIGERESESILGRMLPLYEIAC